MENKRRTVPLWALIVTVLCTVGMFTTLVWAASTQFHNTLPYVGELLFTDPELQIESFKFTYDSYTMTYTAANVGVKNYGAVAHSGSLNIYLYDMYGTKIAEGIKNTGLVNPSITVGITVTMNWVTGYTVANLTSGNFQLITQS